MVWIRSKVKTTKQRFRLFGFQVEGGQLFYMSVISVEDLFKLRNLKQK